MTAILNSLPPGFRFLPTDEELIHYLKNKLNARASIIAGIDLYKLNPWELPDEAYFGDGEWFCFSPRYRKYPKGARPKRTAASGYWKAIGTDKPSISGHAFEYLGVKKALIFYKGRAPKGTNTNWMMHEYRLPNNSHLSLDDWVLCRIHHKGVSKKRISTNGSGNSCTSDVEVYEGSMTINENYNFGNCQNTWIEEGLNLDKKVDCEENMKLSLEDALESIKRVLSLGAFDELVAE